MNRNVAQSRDCDSIATAASTLIPSYKLRGANAAKSIL